ncbi:E3 ubiquitin-protein ligase RNF169-like isoform X2 [Oratosquilla oratoria]|uniref:E3 ubiquitin-protein ligase RNF169-like isoform X2 n=1 Tax=Oratosquilla oratoria TaxID=337810 RepID=UPI003F772881
MASSSKGKSRSLNDLCLGDVICPICISILIEPVTMPCKHCLCMPCFEKNVSEANLSCPMCRTRISVWVRRATKEKCLVDEPLWQWVKENFHEKVEARLLGLEDSDEESYIPRRPNVRLSTPGEIKQEYEEQMEKLRSEQENERLKEEEASKQLIQKLQAEETVQLRKRQEETKRDAEFAQALKEEEILSSPLMVSPRGRLSAPLFTPHRGSKTPRPNSTPIRGPMDAYIGGTNYQRCASDLSSASSDSIRPELSHFKPIRAAPCTPPKKLPDGRTIAPKFIKSTPRKIAFDSATEDGENPGHMATRPQLKEITHSQSSGSDMEDTESTRPRTSLSTNDHEKENRSNLLEYRSKRLKSKSSSVIKTWRESKSKVDGNLDTDSDDTDMDESDISSSFKRKISNITLSDSSSEDVRYSGVLENERKKQKYENNNDSTVSENTFQICTEEVTSLLQEEVPDEVNRKRGSDDAYLLRSEKPRGSNKKSVTKSRKDLRQPTLNLDTLHHASKT